MKSILLILTFCFFVTHEMDAMLHGEWRMLPVLNGMDDNNAAQLFLLLHIPLFFGLIWSLFIASWRSKAAIAFSLLIILHSIAHFILSNHALYSFVPPIETITVYGAALSSLGYFVSVVAVKE